MVSRRWLKRMIFLDINTFFCSRGGGIKTYHHAKIAWFQNQTRHHYYLVSPGARFEIEPLGERVTLVRAYGIPVGQGYRLLIDYGSVLRCLRRYRPDVVEAGDPYLTGVFVLLTRQLWRFATLLSAFYHSDPIRTSVAPWAQRPGVFRAARRAIAHVLGRVFYGAQRRYDVTVTASGAMRRHLAELGVDNTALLPFGVDPVFFQPRDAERQCGERDEIRLLYVGRLGKEKGIELLIDILPRLLEMPGVSLTVIGKGNYEAAFAEHPSPRLHYLGYVGDRAELAAIYRRHHVLLAPGPFETFGLSVLEALASGSIAVGPDAGGTAEMLAELNPAFTFRSGEAADFLRATIAASRASFAAESAKSRAVAERYGTWDKAIGRLIEFYESRVVEPADAPRAPLSGPKTRHDRGRTQQRA